MLPCFELLLHLKEICHLISNRCCGAAGYSPALTIEMDTPGVATSRMQSPVATATTLVPLAWMNLFLLLSGLCIACMIDVICSTHLRVSAVTERSDANSWQHAITHEVFQSSDGDHSALLYRSHNVYGKPRQHLTMDEQVFMGNMHGGWRRQLEHAAKQTHGVCWYILHTDTDAQLKFIMQ